MRATATTSDPRTTQMLPDGAEIVGVDELDVNGRSLNRPVPIKGCSKSGCARYFLDALRLG